MSTSLAFRIVRAENELRERQRLAAANMSPFDVFSDIGEANLAKFLQGRFPRPVVPPPPPGADRDLWNQNARFVEAMLDVLEGRGLPKSGAFRPDLHAILLRWQRKYESGELFEDEPDPASPSTTSTAPPAPSRPISHSDDSPDSDVIFEDLP